MINIDTLATVLRVLGRSAPPRSMAPTPVSAVLAPARIGSGDGPSASTDHGPEAARDSTDVVTTVDEHGQRTPDTRPTPPLATAIMRATSGAPSPAISHIAISSAGTLLLDAMNVPQQERGPVIHAPNALLSSPPHDPPALARAIERAITSSGVFYESHVARWADNDFPAAELAREPQASWAVASPERAPPGASPGVTLLHEQAPTLLRQQLEAHEAHRLLLTAELWPGRQATLQFEEPGHTRDHAGGASPQEGERLWSTRIDLTLESLGNVTAVVALRNGEIQCNLRVGTRDAQARLNDARSDLDAALRRQSLALAQWAISHE